MNRFLLRIALFISARLQASKRKKEKRLTTTFADAEALRIRHLPVNTGKKAGTMVIKCDDIGDFMAWQQVAPHIMAHAPKPLTFVCNLAVKPLVELYFDFADTYIWIDKSQWANQAYRDSMYKAVRALNPDIAFTTLFTRNIKLDDMILLASDATERTAWDLCHHAYFPYISLPAGICTKTIRSNKPIELEYFRNIEFVERVFNIRLEHAIHPLFPHFGKQNRLLIFPVANIRSKNWNSKGFAELIRAVSSHVDSILLLGGSNAVETAREIETMAREPKLINLCGQTSLPELFAFIGESRLLVCPDTAALHFSVQTATDTLVLSNGNNWQRFVDYAPYVSHRMRVLYPKHFTPIRNQVKTVYSGMELQSLKAADVIEAVVDMLSTWQKVPH